MKKVFANIMWRFSERTLAQGIEFIVAIILARVLEPDEYGKAAIIMAFIAIMQVFVEAGFGSALIQKKDADELDYSTVFFFNIAFCLGIYLLVFIFAPLFSNLYHDSDYTKYIRFTGIIIIISGIKNVQQAYISKHLQFKSFFFATLFGTIISGIAGIYMALHGYGVWALIWQRIINTFVDTVLVWFVSDWRPILKFSLQRLNGMWEYGWKLLVSNLIDSSYGNLWQFAIGYNYSPSGLAFYNRGRSIPNLIVNNINTSIDNVLFPVMSTQQKDKLQLRIITRKAIMICVFFMTPILIMIAFCSRELVEIILTSKWNPCVFYLRLFCIMYVFQPIHTANTNVIKAVGRSDMYLKIEIIKKIVGLITLAIALRFSLKVLVILYVAENVVNQIINSFPSKKLIGYSYIEQIKDIMPSIFMAIVASGLASLTVLLKLDMMWTLVVRIILTLTIYFAGSIYFNIGAWGYVKEIVQGIKNENTKKDL